MIYVEEGNSVNRLDYGWGNPCHRRFIQSHAGGLAARRQQSGGVIAAVCCSGPSPPLASSTLRTWALTGRAPSRRRMAISDWSRPVDIETNLSVRGWLRGRCEAMDRLWRV
jgi:hypothetical protein